MKRFASALAVTLVALTLVRPSAGSAQSVALPAAQSTEVTLPLKQGEYVLKYADGRCAALSRRAQNDSITTSVWIGACRAGLADGSGFLLHKDGSYTRAVARHGIVDENAGSIGSAYSSFSEQPPHQFLLFASAVGLDAPSFDPAFVFNAQNIGERLETGIKIQAIKRPCPGWDASKKFYPVTVTINNATGTTGPSDDQSIIAQCGVNPGKKITSGVLSAVMQRNPQLSLIWISETKPGSRAIRVTVCSAPDCRDTWRQLTTPYRQQWQTFIDDTKARTASWQLDVDTRIAPLIAAQKASVSAATMRLGATYRPRVAAPSSAPAKPKTAVRKRK